MRARVIKDPGPCGGRPDRVTAAGGAADLAVDERAAGASGCASVVEVVGQLVRADLDGGGGGIGVGEVLAIAPVCPVATGSFDNARIPAQVVGFRAGRAILMPLAGLRGVGPGARVYRWARQLTVTCGDELLSRVVDGLGRPLDGCPALVGESVPVERPALNPLGCPVIEGPLPTGVRAIDGLMTLGWGQRVGLFAGPGAGKSSLLARLANGFDGGDGAGGRVCVICLVGERGRDIRSFVRRRLSAESRGRTVVVCARSDAPGLVRATAPFLATAIAEWFCERRGARVLLLVDSLTRMARAQREVGLAAGEIPVRQGFPPSVFARLAQLVERAGPRPQGSITGVYSVLTEGERADDPVAAEVRSLVDGHIALSGERAARGMWPAIDVLASVSRAMDEVTSVEHRRAAGRVRRMLALYRDHEQLLAMGAYRSGLDREVDAAIAGRAGIDGFLCHEGAVGFHEVLDQLLGLVGGVEA